MVRCFQLVDRVFFLDACSFRSRSGFVAYAFHTRCFCREDLCLNTALYRNHALLVRLQRNVVSLRALLCLVLGLQQLDDVVDWQPVRTLGPETWHTDILLKSALQDHSCSFSFKWLDTSWKNPQPRALEQVIGNGPNPVFCSSGLMLCTEITQSGHRRRPSLAPRSTQPRFIFLRWDAWPSIRTRAALFTMMTIIMTMDGPMQCPSRIQGMKIRIRSSRTLESFAAEAKQKLPRAGGGVTAICTASSRSLQLPQLLFGKAVSRETWTG
jgi:hypothetical protein